MNLKINQIGMTIVELMVAMLLGLLLIGGVTQVYFGTKATYQATEHLSWLQENTRTSVDMLAKDIRMAGYVPCSQPETVSNVLDTGVNDWWGAMFQNVIQGYEGGVSTFPQAIANEVAPNTDAIVILRGGPEVAAVNYFDSSSNEFVLQHQGNDWIEKSSILIACDPAYASLFQAGSASGTQVTRVGIASTTGEESPGNTTTNLGRAFGTDSQLTNYSPAIYYIAESKSENGFSLYREYTQIQNNLEIISKSEELVEGVENMQLLYGLDENGNDGVADRYVKADVVTAADAWDQVVTVRIGLLYATKDNVRSDIDSDIYTIANTSIGPMNDKRRRYVSSLTINIRNRAI